MELDYETSLRRDEEVARRREARIQRELLGESTYVDLETGCTPEEMDATPAADTNRKEAA